jgi:hypothetical protein
MKLFLRTTLRTLIIISPFFFLFSCNDRQIKEDNTSFNDSSQIVTIINSDSLISTLTKQVLTSIKNKDFKKLPDFIHPTLGVRFSPYAYIDTTSDLKFTANNFYDQIKKQNKFNWGGYDGSGDTILLTIEDYFSKFVYNADFLNAEKTSLNKMIGGGNSLNNLETVYKGCNFSESYFSGFDKKFDGMDWCCLRLVFKKNLEKFYLVGIVHDQWTI